MISCVKITLFSKHFSTYRVMTQSGSKLACQVFDVDKCTKWNRQQSNKVIIEDEVKHQTLDCT